jgi:hypothetical protein
MMATPYRLMATDIFGLVTVVDRMWPARTAFPSVEGHATGEGWAGSHRTLQRSCNAPSHDPRLGKPD